MARRQGTASDALRLDASRQPPVISSAPEIGPHRAVRNDHCLEYFQRVVFLCTGRRSGPGPPANKSHGADWLPPFDVLFEHRDKNQTDRIN
jgi:hypothetical protein